MIDFFEVLLFEFNYKKNTKYWVFKFYTKKSNLIWRNKTKHSSWLIDQLIELQIKSFLINITYNLKKQLPHFQVSIKLVWDKISEKN